MTANRTSRVEILAALTGILARVDGATDNMYAETLERARFDLEVLKVCAAIRTGDQLERLAKVTERVNL